MCIRTITVLTIGMDFSYKRRMRPSTVLTLIFFIEDLGAEGGLSGSNAAFGGAEKNRHLRRKPPAFNQQGRPVSRAVSRLNRSANLSCSRLTMPRRCATLRQSRTAAVTPETICSAAVRVSICSSSLSSPARKMLPVPIAGGNGAGIAYLCRLVKRT